MMSSTSFVRGVKSSTCDPSPKFCFQIGHECRIPKKHISCIECGDFDYEYRQIKYQIYLILEDEDREQILISINDTVWVLIL